MYNPKIRPLREDLAQKIALTDWEEISRMLVGWDIYVDVEGNVGFYEGNSSPFALTNYEEMYGNDLNEALVMQMGDAKVIGINVNIGVDAGPARNLAARHAKRVLEESGLEVITANEATTRFDLSTGKFYFDNGKRQDIDILLNRCPGAQRNIRKQVPRRHWARAPAISPAAHTLILSNKERTRRALERFGLDLPVAYVAENDSQRREAMAKVMEHIRAKHPGYEAPFIFIKPIAGTGARGTRVFKDDKSVPSKPIQYPCLVGERISAAGIVEADGTHIVDTRMFYCGGHASKAVVRVAPLSLEDADHGNWFSKQAYVTNLCQGGHPVTMESSAENVLNQYALAATIALDEAAKLYARRQFE
jgi:hypothetical protein